MRTIRLLPVVVLAASALLAFKAVGLVTGEGYVLSGAAFAQADAAQAEASGPDDAALDAAAMRAADNLFAAPAGAGSASEPDAEPSIVGRDGEPVPLRALDGADTGQALLDRLTERRLELDAYAEELETRLALLEAAERRLDERAAELAALEAEINSLVDRQRDGDDEQFAALVSMYENMRPRDAATVFDGLSMDVLVRVARAMAPRRMSPILAQMQTERARELTLRLAVGDVEPAREVVADGFGDLPQIVGE